MADRRILVLAIAALAALAGCIGGEEAPDVDTQNVDTENATPEPTGHALANATEPSDFTAPSFDVLGTVAATGPGYGGGEPGVWAHTNGSLFVAFPGCETGRGHFLANGVQDQTRECLHGPIYRSDDDGSSWIRLNTEQDGRLSEEGPGANGDNDVTVDANGTVYASNLGSGIQAFRSTDGGSTWTYLGNLVPEDHSSDRQWMAAADPGHVIATWMGGGNGTDRAVAVRTTFDAGDSWTELNYLGENIGWLGTVQFAPDGEHAYIPFTQRLDNDTEKHPFDYGEFALKVARTSDGGQTWDVVDTGTRVTTSDTGTHWSGVLMAPSLDVTGDGSLAYVYSEEVTDPTGTTATKTRVRVVTSPDGGDTWNDPTTISTSEQAIMPWITGGAGDRAMVTWFSSPIPGDSDYVGQWSVQAASLDGLGTGEPEVERTTIAENVHTGGICARGGFCIITGSDRALLDYFENDVTPDGRLVVTYPADPVTDGKQININVAVQDGGSPLLVDEG